MPSHITPDWCRRGHFSSEGPAQRSGLVKGSARHGLKQISVESTYSRRLAFWSGQWIRWTKRLAMVRAIPVSPEDPESPPSSSSSLGHTAAEAAQNPTRGTAASASSSASASRPPEATARVPEHRRQLLEQLARYEQARKRGESARDTPKGRVVSPSMAPARILPAVRLSSSDKDLDLLLLD
eukprot:RCo049490